MDARILIASNGVNEAESCRRLLEDKFENIVLSTDADSAVKDYEAAKPNVLILAFEELEAAERYYLGLYRLSEAIHTQVHRTIVLSTKNNVRDVYRLCCKEHFDDYVLFWPLTHDAPRLLMAVHHAVRALDDPNDVRTLQKKVETHIKRIATLESILDERLSDHASRADAATASVEKGEQQVGAAIESFESRLFEGEMAYAVEIKEPAVVRNELGKLKVEGVKESFRSISESVEAMHEWAGSLKQDLVPQLESVRSLTEISRAARPLVLIVDDDEFQHKILKQMLRDEDMDFVFASSGVEALAGLRKHRPDLILLDYEMPQFNGVEVLRRLKSSKKFGSIPIVMVTGISDREVVGEAVKAGVADFVVKPFERDVVISKIRRFLGASYSQPNDTRKPKAVTGVSVIK